MDDGEKVTERLLAELAALARRIEALGGVSECNWRKCLEEAVHGQARAEAEGFGTAPDAILLLNNEIPPRVLECSEVTSAIFGYDPGELVGKSVGLLHVSEESLQEFWDLARTALSAWRGWYCLGDFRMRRKDGSVFVAEHAIAQLVDQMGKRVGWVDIVRDTSDRSGQAKLLMSIGAHDAATGLPNQLLLHDRASVAFADARRRGIRAAMMILSLDWPRAGVESMGEESEDLLMWCACQQLEGILRKSDTFARVGRNEFAILLAGLEREDGSAKAAERVLAALSRAYPLNECGSRPTSSIGIALYPDDGEDPAGVARRARAAMYWAKGRGGDGYQRYVPCSP